MNNTIAIIAISAALVIGATYTAITSYQVDEAADIRITELEERISILESQLIEKNVEYIGLEKITSQVIKIANGLSNDYNDLQIKHNDFSDKISVEDYLKDGFYEEFFR